MIKEKCTRRIVSLVPSLTETVVQLGLRSELVACTSFCVEPASLHREVTLIGGTKDFDVEKILALSPTHVLANQEENTRSLVEALMARVATLVTFPKGPNEVPTMIKAMGEFLDCDEPAKIMANELTSILSFTAQRIAQPRSFVYLIWRSPYMIAGPDTYISRLLESFGWRNAYSGDERYPALEVDQINTIAPDHIFLSSEPFAFRTRHISMLRDDGIICDSVTKIDGRMCSWFGWRTIEALKYIRSLNV